MDLHKRVYSNKALKSSSALVGGWVQDIRVMGGLAFITLRDREGLIQLTFHKQKVSPEVFKTATEEITKESVILAKGKIIKNPKAPGGAELIPDEIKILSLAESPVPLEFGEKIESGLDKRLDYRFLDLRNPKVAGIFKIQAGVASAVREFYKMNGFIEMFSAKLVAQPPESGANAFPCIYFNTEGFLTQSPQFYKQMMMATSFDKICEIGPVFRAEKHHTSRHLCEYTSIDFEQAFIKDYSDIMKTLEDMTKHIIGYVIKNHKRELEILNVTLKKPSYKFPAVTMREAYKMVEAKGFKVDYGDDLSTEAEREFGMIMKKEQGVDFAFLTEFPWKVRPFYTMRNKDDPEWTESFDLIYLGQEMTTGGQREHRYDILKKQLVEKGMNPKTMEWYLNFFRYGMPPHGGSGTGIERICQKLLGMPNIRDVRLLPRDPTRLTP